MTMPSRALHSETLMATTTPTGLQSDLAGVIGHLLRKSHLAAQRCFAAAFDGTDISPVQCALLSTIGCNPGISHKALAHAVAAAPSVATIALKSMIEAGLVAQRRGTEDARSSTYQLTAEGADTLIQLQSRLTQASHQLEAPLTTLERDTLRKLLAKLVAAHPS